jgi:hypothetical protein
VPIAIAVGRSTATSGARQLLQESRERRIRWLTLCHHTIQTRRGSILRHNPSLGTTAHARRVAPFRLERGPHFLGHALAASGFYVSTEHDRRQQHVQEPIMRKRASRATPLDPHDSPRRPSAKPLSLSTETLRSLRSIAERDLDVAWGGRGSCSHAITGCG